MENQKSTPRAVPYEELSITHAGNSQYLLKTPWLSLQVTLESNPIVDRTLQAFANQELEKVDFKVLSDFLLELNLPFFYLLPNQDSSTTTDLQITHFQHVKEIKDLEKNELRLALGLKPVSAEQNQWQWDTEGVLSFSKLESQSYSPSSILSIARRFHYLDCSEKDQTSKLYELCQSEDSSWQMSFV